MTERVYNVLFLCTGNSARSILAESILNALGRGRFRAYSAGSQPSGVVNPLVLDLLRRQKHPTESLHSKSWETFAEADAPAMDFVFTVCDNAAQESCPVWPGQPMTAHWGIEDPAAETGNDAARAEAVNRAFRVLSRRIEIFLNLPITKLDQFALQGELNDIGRSATDTPAAD